MAKRKKDMQTEPFTGVGAPGPGAEAGGAELGGDTGDVGTPRTEIGGNPGGTYGTSRMPGRSGSSSQPSTETPEGTSGRHQQRKAA